MKRFVNLDVRTVPEAVAALARARREGRTAIVAGGGSDVLGLMKERLLTPDVLVNLKTIDGAGRIDAGAQGVTIGGLATLESIASQPVVRASYRVLAEAAESVGTPQIRAVGTLAGNVCQRPWCWYFRNNFPCFKRGGDTCFAAAGENQHHAIFGGGPSFIVHPSDTAPALVALEARFGLAGPNGSREVSSADFFTLPERDVLRENVLGEDELLVRVTLPTAPPGRRSTYRKVLDREAWTHAVVSVAAVLDMDGETCRRARLVLGGVAPVPWRVPDVERLLEGKRITPQVADEAGRAAVAAATPLAKNAYKVALTRTVVRRTLAELAGASPRA